MYKKNLVTTVALATVISLASACGKEEVVSTLDTAQEVVSTLDTVQEVVASVEQNGAELSVEEPVKENKPEVDESEKETPDEAPTEVVEDSTAMPMEEFKALDTQAQADYLNSIPIEVYEESDEYYDLFVEGMRSFDCDLDSEHADYLLKITETDNTEDERYKKLKEALYEAYVKSGIGDVVFEAITATDPGPEIHPTGPKASYHPTSSVVWQTTETRGNIS